MDNSNLSESTTSKKSKKSLEDYEFVQPKNKNTDELGRGAFGSVRLVKDKQEQKLYALKTVNLT
jgi:hypothetical protein